MEVHDAFWLGMVCGIIVSGAVSAAVLWARTPAVAPATPRSTAASVASSRGIQPLNLEDGYESPDPPKELIYKTLPLKRREGTDYYSKNGSRFSYQLIQSAWLGAYSDYQRHLRNQQQAKAIWKEE